MKFSPETARLFAQRGGRARTPAKRRAARLNGKKHRGRLVGSLDVMGSSRSDEWYTPLALFAELSAEFGGFTLDPCCTPESALCLNFYTREDDGLAKPWSGRVFMNPPYGRPLGSWMKKAWEESQRGALVVCLIPARVDTAWWHDYAVKGEVRFLKGRLQFANSQVPAPFPSAIVIFRPGHNGATGQPGSG